MLAKESEFRSRISFYGLVCKKWKPVMSPKTFQSQKMRKNQYGSFRISHHEFFIRCRLGVNGHESLLLSRKRASIAQEIAIRFLNNCFFQSFSVFFQSDIFEIFGLNVSSNIRIREKPSYIIRI